MQDPVSDKERLYNETIYSRQGDRNPFNDNPAWVASISGGECEASVITREILLDKIERRVSLDRNTELCQMRQAINGN